MNNVHTLIWEIVAKSTFQELKKKFILALILATFDLERQIMLKIDILDYIISIYISQSNKEGWLQSITFYS
jgi:hypothetical protein